MSESPQDDAGLVIITITLPAGTDARVRVTSRKDSSPPGDGRTGRGLRSRPTKSVTSAGTWRPRPQVAAKASLR